MRKTGVVIVLVVIGTLIAHADNDSIRNWILDSYVRYGEISAQDGSRQMQPSLLSSRLTATAPAMSSGHSPSGGSWLLLYLPRRWRARGDSCPIL